MPKDPIRRQQALKQKERKERQTPYQRLYGLRENPFPTLALFSPSIDDPRRDGRIYDESFRQEEEEAFLDLFVQTQAGDRPLELGFVRVDPSAGGRGNGKSVFLHHIAERINNQEWEEEWHVDHEDPELFSLAVHILPEPRKQRRFWQLIYLIFETLASNDLFSVIDTNFRAAILYNLLSEDQTDELLDDEGEIDEALASNDLFFDILERFNLSHSAFIEEAERQIEIVAMAAINARFMSDFGSADFSLVKLWKKWKDKGFAPNDYQWRKHGMNLFTDGLIPTMIVAGYSRLFLLLDEFEKIYIYQNNRERDEFLDSLRQYFYERDSTLVRNRYITTILTIHPSIYRYLASNWQRVGLDYLAPLDTKRMSSCSVELGASTMEKLTNLIVTYIDFYRIDEDDKNFGTIFPFDQDAIEPAIEASRYYPRGALWYAYMILRKAAKDGIGPPITREFVEDFIKEGEKPPIEDEDALFQLPISSNDA